MPKRSWNKIKYRLWHRKYSILLSTLVVYLFSLSFNQSGNIILLENISLAMVLIASVNASHELHGKKAYIYGIVVIISLLFSELNTHLNTSHAFLIIIFLSWVAIKFLRRLLRDKKIDIDYLSGAVGGYLLLGIIGGYIAIIINTLIPESFYIGSTLSSIANEQLTFIYWSFSTLTTLGYGDISPISSFATTSSILLVVVGQIYLTVLLGIMLGKFLNFKK